jgi:hypothetical protein
VASDEEPRFGALYLVVLGALALYVLLGAILTQAYR